MPCNYKFSGYPLPYIFFWLCHGAAVCMEATCFALLSYSFLFWYITEPSFGDKGA